MKKTLAILFALFYGVNVFSQDIDGDKVFSDVQNAVLYIDLDELPKFESKNYKSATEYIYDNIQYPQKIDAQGFVIVSFVVTQYGDIADVVIERGLCKECDNEVVKALLSMPRWTPGKKCHKVVNTRCCFR